jgi:hypothetical protein
MSFPESFAPEAGIRGHARRAPNVLMESFDGVLYDLLREPVDKTIATWWGRPMVASRSPAAKFASHFGLALGSELARILSVMYAHRMVHGDLHFSNVGYKVVAHEGARVARPQSPPRSPSLHQGGRESRSRSPHFRRDAPESDYAREPSTFTMEAELVTKIKLLVFDFDYEFGYDFGKVSVARMARGAGSEPATQTQMSMETLAGNIYDALKVAHALRRAASAAESDDLAHNRALCSEALVPVLRYARLQTDVFSSTYPVRGRLLRKETTRDAAGLLGSEAPFGGDGRLAASALLEPEVAEIVRGNILYAANINWPEHADA